MRFSFTAHSNGSYLTQSNGLKSYFILGIFEQTANINNVRIWNWIRFWFFFLAELDCRLDGEEQIRRRRRKVATEWKIENKLMKTRARDFEATYRGPWVCNMIIIEIFFSLVKINYSFMLKMQHAFARHT